MTPTEQDKELREKLTKLISQDGWVDTQEVDVDGQVNELVALITADRKRVALGARIDAAEHILNTMVHEAGGYCDEIDPDDITNYIAELKSQQEEV